MCDIYIVNLHFEPNRSHRRDHEHENVMILENIIDRALQVRVEERRVVSCDLRLVVV